MKKFRLFLLSVMIFILPGCDHNSIDSYESKKTKIDLRDFFDGDVEGWGSLFDRQGRQTRSFHVRLKGTWNKNKGVLEEWFVFDDGEKTERTWEIDFSNETSFIGKAKDVVGLAKGRQKGNAVNLDYVLTIPYNNSTINLRMDDWMYLIEDNMILNRTTMKKYGFQVGEIVLFMKKKT